MDLKKLSTLKDKMVNAEDFSEPWNYFFDHFGESPAFMGLGKTTRPGLLEPIVQEVGAQLFGKDVSVSPLMLMKIPEYDFVHGSCFINGQLAAIIYFKDIDMGLLSVITPTASHSLETSLIRISSYMVEPSKAIHFHPAGGTSTH